MVGSARTLQVMTHHWRAGFFLLSSASMISPTLARSLASTLFFLGSSGAVLNRYAATIVEVH
jgi:hypothetical protein